ncbi:hypothetical protein ACERK3_03655 [Phycisphaerales bacterium AB-hyl4]|uniref:Uncharacterized protein n=1 Tax=Natronomicrosphaera hydrolytica TaxID=3242702 RepID=A0ABV4U3P0_9BACT
MTAPPNIPHTTTRTTPGSLLTAFAILGGALAWLSHLLLAYLIAEFGCLTALRHPMLFQLTGVAWGILLVSGLTFAVAVASIFAAHRLHRVLTDTGHAPQANLRFLARFGRISNLLFAFVIVFQSVPIFFYLGAC